MLIKQSARPVRTMKNVMDGNGELTLHDLTTPETLPDNLRVLCVISLKPGEAVGHHTHTVETEVYHCLKGEGVVHDNGKDVLVYPGDTVVAPSGTVHGIKNTSLSDFELLAIVVHD